MNATFLLVARSIEGCATKLCLRDFASSSFVSSAEEACRVFRVITRGMLRSRRVSVAYQQDTIDSSASGTATSFVLLPACLGLAVPNRFQQLLAFLDGTLSRLN